MIRLCQISKKLRGETVLEDVSMEVPDSNCVCVLGKSGAGKSVLLKITAGIMAPDSGRVFYDHQALNYGPFSHNQQIIIHTGFVFQTGALFDGMNVGENVGLPLRERIRISEKELRERVRASLVKVGLPDVVNLRIKELSGGMVKLVALARALITEPKYVFLDEPTGGLDPISRDRVLDIVQNLRKTGKAVLAVTHDLDFARQVADRIYILKGKKVYVAGGEIKKEDYE